MANVKVSGGIGKHGQGVEFRALAVFVHLVDMVSRPPLLPLFFRFREGYISEPYLLEFNPSQGELKVPHHYLKPVRI